ncbi:MAG: DUF6782 family putative metallopeptidase [Pseudomonadota bacterium]
MKPSQIQRQLKDRIKGTKLPSYSSLADQNKAFDFTSVQNNDVWSLDLLCSDFSSDSIVLDNHKDILSWSVGVLLSSPTARLLIKEAAKNGWMISIADREGYDFHLDVAEKQIILDDNGLSAAGLGRSEYFRNVLLVSMVRALRDVWQEKRHGGFDEQYGPEDILMLERVRAADCDVISVVVAWELRGEGCGDLWRHMIGSEEGDLAMAFSGYLERDPTSNFSNDAMKAAFNQWYRNEERISSCDHETLEYMDSFVREEGCRNPFGSENLTPVGIEILSCLPDKTAYLQGHGREILGSPFYAGLNDDINQSHLTQILYDMKVFNVQGVPFRDSYLADKIFPDGALTLEEEGVYK